MLSIAIKLVNVEAIMAAELAVHGLVIIHQASVPVNHIAHLTHHEKPMLQKMHTVAMVLGKISTRPLLRVVVPHLVHQEITLLTRHMGPIIPSLISILTAVHVTGPLAVFVSDSDVF